MKVFRIALTFDDGPHPRTAKILEVLAHYRVPATFFVIGSNCERLPRLLRAVHAGGHEIGNHGWSRTSFRHLSTDAIISELDRTHRVIRTETGLECRFYRPPYGAITVAQRRFVSAATGYRIVLWNVDSLDWQHERAEFLLERTSLTYATSIVLLHDFAAVTASSLPKLIERLLKGNHTFHCVSEVLPITETLSQTSNSVSCAQQKPKNP